MNQRRGRLHGFDDPQNDLAIGDLRLASVWDVEVCDAHFLSATTPARPKHRKFNDVWARDEEKAVAFFQVIALDSDGTLLRATSAGRTWLA